MSDADAVAEARGEVLAGLAALQGLSDLLRSRRVGVKALSRALPEMGAGFPDVEEAVIALFAGIDPPLEHAPAVVARVSTLLSKLRAELLAASSGLDARSRISLERGATVARGELEAALCVGELAAAAIARRVLTLDLGDLLRHRWKDPLRQVDSDVVVEVAIEEGAIFSGDPKIAIALLELAISCVRAVGVAEPRVSVNRREDGRLVARVGERQGATPVVVAMRVSARSCYPEMIRVAIEAAGRAGIDIEREESGRALTIVF